MVSAKRSAARSSGAIILFQYAAEVPGELGNAVLGCNSRASDLVVGKY